MIRFFVALFLCTGCASGTVCSRRCYEEPVYENHLKLDTQEEAASWVAGLASEGYNIVQVLKMKQACKSIDKAAKFINRPGVVEGYSGLEWYFDGAEKYTSSYSAITTREEYIETGKFIEKIIAILLEPECDCG